MNKNKILKILLTLIILVSGWLYIEKTSDVENEKSDYKIIASVTGGIQKDIESKIVDDVEVLEKEKQQENIKDEEKNKNAEIEDVKVKDIQMDKKETNISSSKEETKKEPEKKPSSKQEDSKPTSSNNNTEKQEPVKTPEQKPVQESQRPAEQKPTTSTNGGSQDINQTVSDLEQALQILNNERTNKGLSKLTYDNGNLQKAVDYRANEITQNFAHSYKGGPWYYVLNDFNVTYTTGGENICGGFNSYTDAVNAWLKSPGHYQNMMLPKVTRVAIGRKNNYFAMILVD